MYKYPSIALMVQPENAASIAVAQKAGFQFVEDIMSESGGMDRPVVQKLYRLTNPAC